MYSDTIEGWINSIIILTHISRAEAGYIVDVISATREDEILYLEEKLDGCRMSSRKREDILRLLKAWRNRGALPQLVCAEQAHAIVDSVRQFDLPPTNFSPCGRFFTVKASRYDRDDFPGIKPNRSLLRPVYA